MESSEINSLGRKNHGFLRGRISHNPREKAFAEVWEAENNSRPGINFGCGTLQDLFFGHRSIFGADCVHRINLKERFVAATLIQWLGTNCGMSFLDTALHKCGYKIVELDWKEREAMRAEDAPKFASRFLDVQ